MESNQIDTYNISSNVLNNLSVSVDTSLTSASNCSIGTVTLDSITWDSITDPCTYDYYLSRPNIVSLPGVIYNSAPISFDFSSIVYGDCFRLKSNRKHIKLEFCL